MQQKVQTIHPKQELGSQTHKVISAFDSGDMDLARRILLASYHHHTRAALTITERLNLWWCLAWFAFYEGCMEKGEIYVRQILELEESLVVRREHRIIYAKFVLSIFCTNLGKTNEAEMCRYEVVSLLDSLTLQSSNRELLTSP